MTTIEVIESLAKMPSGAVFTDENRYDQLYLISIANKFRAETIREYYRMNRRINPICYQRFFPQFVEEVQYEWCYKRFACPPPINLDDISNGFRFVGTINSSRSFDVIKSRGELATFKMHPVLNPSSGRNPCALYDGTTGYWELYGTDAKFFVVEMIMHDITNSPELNLDKSQFPMSSDLFPMFESMVYQANTSISSSTQPDLAPDSADVGIARPQPIRARRNR